MGILSGAANAAVKTVVDQMAQPSGMRMVATGDDPQRMQFDHDQLIQRESAIRERSRTVFWVSALTGAALFFVVRVRRKS